MPPGNRTWHHVVLTTYGAWLPGDPRGFRTRHHRQHVEGDYKSPPPAGAYAGQFARSRALLKHDPVSLSAPWRQRLGRALWQELTRSNAWLLVVAVSKQQVHLLVKLPGQSPRPLVGRAKRGATIRLRADGWRGALWGVRSKSVQIRDRAHQENAFRYIARHAQEGAWVRSWRKEGIDDPS
jgi:hypothetical protein